MTEVASRMIRASVWEVCLERGNRDLGTYIVVSHGPNRAMQIATDSACKRNRCSPADIQVRAYQRLHREVLIDEGTWKT